MVNVKIIASVMSIFIAIVILATALIPVINDASTTKTTETITNEGAAAIKLSKITTGFSLDMSVENDGSDLSITIGSDTITAELNPMFILSTDSAAIYVNDDSDVIAIWTADGSTQQITLSGDFTVETTDSYLVINDGSDHNLPLPSTYMFVPSSTGVYGSFTEGGLNRVPNDPIIAAGFYAGVAAYNADTTLGDSLVENVTATDEVITSVSWNIPVPDLDQLNVDLIDPFNPGDISITPIDIDPINPGNQLMAVPTPTYTDGDWGFDTTAGRALIVSYSGPGGDMVIPAAVSNGSNTYNAYDVGKGTSNATVLNNSTIASNSTITFSTNTVRINSYAFANCTNLTGNLIIPDRTTKIDSYAFSGCSGFTGSLDISHVKTIGSAAISLCSGFDGVLICGAETYGDVAFSQTPFSSLVLVGSPTSFGNNVFDRTNIKQVLNLSSAEIGTDSYGLNADSVQDHIDASVYLATINYTVETTSPNGYAALYAAIPLIIVASIVVAVIGLMIYNRE